jgi:hypothetical protein
MNNTPWSSSRTERRQWRTAKTLQATSTTQDACTKKKMINLAWTSENVYNANNTAQQAHPPAVGSILFSDVCVCNTSSKRFWLEPCLRRHVCERIALLGHPYE